MPEIQQLSASIVNKIAAGEVIERPASVVKELMENAIDAGSTRIDVAIEKGGGSLVRIADNGCGISSDQLTLAVASHATSKIQSADDLFSVGTLGFRGEALASIAEVSRMRLRSRARDAQETFELEIIGGQLRDVMPSAGAPGTTVEVRDLFYNTPVRRKFLRTMQTEIGHSTEAFIRLALAHPHVHLALSHNGRSLYDFAPTDDWRDRIARFFGQDLADGLIPVESHEGDVRLSGYVANPSHSRGNNRWQYLLLNGRPIRDRAMQHALSEAYRGLLLTGRYPICFLRLEMPARAVDVNVHPTKLEVRFENAGGLYSQLLGTLRTTFLTTDLTARLQGVAPKGRSKRTTSNTPPRRAASWSTGPKKSWPGAPRTSAARQPANRRQPTGPAGRWRHNAPFRSTASSPSRSNHSLPKVFHRAKRRANPASAILARADPRRRCKFTIATSLPKARMV